MSRLRLRSAQAPLDDPQVAYQAARVLGHLEAMGLLPDTREITDLNVGLLRGALENASEAGLPVDLVQFDIGLKGPSSLPEYLDTLEATVENNPTTTELPSVAMWLGPDLSSDLVGIARSSLNRYLTNRRSVPDEVAWRAHQTCLLIGDLAGSYNEVGMRRWMTRGRRELDGMTPIDAVNKAEDPIEALAGLRRLTVGLGSSVSA
jgi:hypothetical protein